MTARVNHQEAEQVDHGILSNSQRTPNYSLAVTYLIGAVILVCMGLGVWIGVANGY